MFEPVSFSVNGEHYLVTRRDLAGGSGSDLQAVSDLELRRLIMNAMDHSGARAKLCAWLDSMHISSERENRLALALRLSALFDGASRFVVWRRRRPVRNTVPVDVRLEDVVADLIDHLSVEESRADAWIEIIVVDEDDEPCPCTDYEIVLSDGRTRKGRTNEHGILRYDGIPDGKCEIRLLGLDDSAWDLA